VPFARLAQAQKRRVASERRLLSKSFHGAYALRIQGLSTLLILEYDGCVCYFRDVYPFISFIIAMYTQYTHIMYNRLGLTAVGPGLPG